MLASAWRRFTRVPEGVPGDLPDRHGRAGGAAMLARSPVRSAVAQQAPAAQDEPRYSR